MEFQVKPKISHFEWKPWFAWYPVRTEQNKIVWLQRVEKRCTNKDSSNAPDAIIICLDSICNTIHRAIPA